VSFANFSGTRLAINDDDQWRKWLVGSFQQIKISMPMMTTAFEVRLVKYDEQLHVKMYPH
jgi:hypothetical protein